MLGLRHLGTGARVLGASVNTSASALSGHVISQVRGAAEILDIVPSVSDADIDVTDAHVGPGYGVPTPESVDAVRLAARTEGLVFDPIYTGKAWAALAHAVRRGTIHRDATVVFLHTGGGPNLFLHGADMDLG